MSARLLSARGLVIGLGLGVRGGIVVGLGLAPVITVLSAAESGFANALRIGLSDGIVYGITYGSIGGVNRQPSPATIRLRGIIGFFLSRFIPGFGFGLISGLIIAPTINSPLKAMALAALSGGLAAGLGSVLHLWLAVPADAARVSSPGAMLALDRTATLVAGLGVALMAGLVFGLTNGLSAAPGSAVPYIGGLTYFLGVGIMFGLARAWGSLAISRAWLALRGYQPWRLMEFLADAHRRGVLRQAGGTYQFRHARLYDRLVAHSNFDQRPFQRSLSRPPEPLR